MQVVGVEREERERPVDDERDAEDVAELAQDLDRDDERRERLPRMLSREEAFPSLDAGERPGDPARRRDGEVEDVEQGVVGDVRI